MKTPLSAGPRGLVVPAFVSVGLAALLLAGCQSSNAPTPVPQAQTQMPAAPVTVTENDRV
jgi:uncharacterized lipoprotein YbaY